MTSRAWRKNKNKNVNWVKMKNEKFSYAKISLNFFIEFQLLQIIRNIKYALHKNFKISAKNESKRKFLNFSFQQKNKVKFF